MLTLETSSSGAILMDAFSGAVGIEVKSQGEAECVGSKVTVASAFCIVLL